MDANEDSILKTVKKIVSIDESYTVFDPDILMHINSALNTLTDLGIGPDEGFMINDAETKWADLLEGNKAMNSVKTYIALKVRMAFDPPQTSFAIAAMEKQISEAEWRLSTRREDLEWVEPVRAPEFADDEDEPNWADDIPLVLDGGDAENRP